MEDKSLEQVSENNLKECPFCESQELREVTNFIVKNSIVTTEIICISCLSCGCDGPKKLYVGNAVEAWNRI